jgi:hypothetical protein
MLVSNDPKFEFINYHGNTSMFALEILRCRGPLEKMKLLSIACLMPHLADYLALFHTVHHNSLVTTRLPLPPELFAAKFVEHQIDFFDLPPMEIDCVISHAAIHCFNDSRYGNNTSSDGWQKPYQVPAKLRQIVGNKPTPVIASIAVNRTEGFYDNNVHLSHERFIESFRKAGFELREYFFDYVCGGIPQKPEYLDFGYRRSKELPENQANPKEWVAGNYYFI